MTPTPCPSQLILLDFKKPIIVFHGSVECPMATILKLDYREKQIGEANRRAFGSMHIPEPPGKLDGIT